MWLSFGIPPLGGLLLIRVNPRISRAEPNAYPENPCNRGSPLAGSVVCASAARDLSEPPRERVCPLRPQPFHLAKPLSA